MGSFYATVPVVIVCLIAAKIYPGTISFTFFVLSLFLAVVVGLKGRSIRILLWLYFIFVFFLLGILILFKDPILLWLQTH